MPDGGVPELLLVDVGGISSAHGELDTLALLRQLCSVFGDTLEAVVVKSHCLHTTARTLKPVGWGTQGRTRGAEGAGASCDAAADAPAATADAPAATTDAPAATQPAEGARAAASKAAAAQQDERVEADTKAAARAAAARAQQLPFSVAPSAPRIRQAIAGRHGGVALLVENCRAENVGLIARTAECLGVPTVHLVYTPEMVASTRAFGGMSADVRASRLERISKRATTWIDVQQHASIDECCEALRARGCELLVATTPAGDGAVPLYGEHGRGGSDDGARWAGRDLVLMFGSEASGLSARALELADMRLTIEQCGLTQSLNVATSAALVVGETLRLRAAQGKAAGLSEEERLALEERLLPDA